jgi:hypothetical protein
MLEALLATQQTINIDYSEVLNYIKAIDDKQEQAKAIMDGFKAGSLVLRIFMTENLSGRKIGIITGALRRSAFVDDPAIVSTAIGGGDINIKMLYGSRGVPYAAIHEFGGDNQTEKRMFRDAAERAMPGIVQQVGLQAIRRLRDAGK